MRRSRIGLFGSTCLLLLATTAGPSAAPLGAAPPTKFRVYLGTYTGGASKGIYRCELDTATGKLTQPVLAGELTSPSFLAIHPNQKYLYAVTEIGDFQGKRTGAVGALAIDPATGNLKLLNQQPSGGAGPCHIVVDKAGKNVLVANYGGGSCASLPIRDDGSLGEATSVRQHVGSSVNKQRQEAPHAHSINLDPANRFAFVADLGLDKVLVYRFDGAQGLLTDNDPPSASVNPGAGPRHFAFHPSGKFAYVINEMASTVTAFTYDADAGRLSPIQSISTLPEGYQGNTSTAEVVVHPSGKFLYGSNRGHNTIAAFAIDPQTGKLTFVAHQGEKVKVPRNFALDPTGQFALVANQDGDSVVVFRVNPQTGALQTTGNSVDVPKPVCVRFVPLATPAGAEGAKTTAQGVKEPPATPAEQLKLVKGFRAELLYSVPKDREGSWVNMCVDPKGRLIVSDQYGGLFRVTPPALHGSAADTKIERINLPIGEAQGLLWAFDSLYIVVNKGQKYDSGLYRATDTDGDGELDRLETLRPINGGGEHGPHAVLPTPDGKALYVICGNGTKLVDLAGSRVPLLWGEDHLLPRMPDGRGFMRDVLAPGGCIYRVDPEGKNWELISNGFRNEFDVAVNRYGDLFTYDSDMEWDLNTPWYRPTRVCLVTSGAEFGWRNGAGKWPAHYADSLPAVVNVGPGSPTGISFGYGAKFPAKYQESLYLCDWSYGKLYALHLEPDGSAYRGTLEEFVTGTPLPLTDVVIHPRDGALYFTTGGRKTKSGLYRVTYTGAESTAPSQPADDAPAADARALRRRLEAFHGQRDPRAMDAAWPHLDSPDRFVRFAARVAIEHQDVAQWRSKALEETRPQAALYALLALVRASAKDPFHRKSGDPEPDSALRGQVLAALARLDWNKLTYSQRCDLARVYHVTLNRLGAPTDAEREVILRQLEPHFPAAGRELNADLVQVLVFLQAPSTAAKAMTLLAKAPTQEEQIEFARALRMLKAGWTPELRRDYFQWFVKAHGYRGGASFGLFVQNIKNDALKTLTDDERMALQSIIDAQPTEVAQGTIAPPRPVVRMWTMAEVAPLLEKGLQGRNFDRGRSLFAAANCFACHRYDNEGGAVGPDLTQLAGRFSARDILESVMEPSKVISDQYLAVSVVTEDGRVVTGRIINLANDNLMINTNMLDPNAIVSVDHRNVSEIVPSKVSMMPEGLLNTLKEDEILDLMAYLLSRGDRNSPMFR